MIYEIPGVGRLELHTVILDLNGTLSVGGKIVSGVHERIRALLEKDFKVILFTGNTRGDADSIANELGIEWMQAKNAQGKAELALGMNPDTCVSIGNGRIDLELMKTVKLRIVTLQAEGVHIETLLHSDVVIPNICDALDLLLEEARLVATLRR